MLEFNCCVWNFNLTQAQENDIERVQKVACQIILQDSYSSYEDALSDLNLMSLRERRQQLCLKFAKRCQKFEKSQDMFPLNDPNSHYTRSHEKFKVNFAETDRLKDSAIPQMQRLLNAWYVLHNVLIWLRDTWWTTTKHKMSKNIEFLVIIYSLLLVNY